MNSFDKDGNVNFSVSIGNILPAGFGGTGAYSICGLDNGDAIVSGRGNHNYGQPEYVAGYSLWLIESDGLSASEILFIADIVSPSDGDEVKFDSVHSVGGQNVALTIYKHNEYSIVKEYTDAGVLVSTISQPTTHTLGPTSTFSDSYNVIDSYAIDEDIVFTNVIVDVATEAYIKAAYKGDGAFLGQVVSDTHYNDMTGWHAAGDGMSLFYATDPSSGNSKIYKITKDTAFLANQTDWYRYPTPASDTGKVSLGTPDLGVSTPVAGALSGYKPHYFELRDIRIAIEAVAVLYENPDTTAAYTTSAGANNIFRIAIDSGQDDWTTPTLSHGARISDEHYSDIELVLDQLEISDRV